MEFFEKAHVVKRKHSNDESTKRQLKQMLYGYKQNDNELIRSAAEIEMDLEDSTSVSGFSDLNLTASSSEGNSTRQRISIIDASNIKTTNNTLNDSTDSEDIRSNDMEASSDDNMSENVNDNLLSELKNDIQSSSDVSIDDDQFSMTSTSSDPSSDIESSESETFDRNGLLASKLLEKLQVSENVRPKKSQSKVRKPESESESSDFVDISKVSEEENNDYNCKQFLDRKLHSRNSKKNMNVKSPTFVSITAEEMTNQSLSEVLGDYKHPTTRNLPSETQNIIFAANSSSMFTNEDLSNVKVKTKSFECVLPESGSEEKVDDTLDDAILDISSHSPENSTSNYDDTLQSSQITERESSTESKDTKFVNPVQVFYCKNACILVMKHPAEIHIHGKIKVKSLGGSVEIGGYTLDDKQHHVFAPNYSYAQFIRTMQHNKHYYGLFGKLTGSGLSVAAAEEIVTTLGDYDAVIHLQSLKSRNLQFVEDNFTVTDIFTKTNKNVDDCFKKASERLGCSLYLMKPWKSFDESNSWNQALKFGYKKQSRGIISGGKGAGKSTFLRYYVNKLLANGPVLVLDLDPGQCEFTVAGNISATIVKEPLLGPNFTHLKTPERMLNIGLINTMDNTKRYVTAVLDLVTYCQSNKQFQDMPWIVNTMGMTNNLGLKFMTLFIMHLQPTFLVQIDSANLKKRFEHNLDSHTVKRLFAENVHRDYLFRSVKSTEYLDYEFIPVSSRKFVKNTYSLKPKDERDLSFLAYFGSLLTLNNESLLAVTPYEVDLRNLYIAVNVRVNPDAITKVINGKIVALCKHSAKDNDAKIFTLEDKPLLCYGHGLIRGIDVEKGLCYVTTPAGGAQLAGVNALAYADWAPELVELAAPAPLPAGLALPYRAPAPDHRTDLMIAPRRRFNPMQLLKMSRNPKLKASLVS